MTWHDLTGVLQLCAVCCVVLCVKPPSVCVPELLPGRLTAHGPRDNSNSPFQKGQQKLFARCPGERKRFYVCIVCNGSRRGKLAFGKYLNCSHCNENGLMACSTCNMAERRQPPAEDFDLP